MTFKKSLVLCTSRREADWKPGKKGSLSLVSRKAPWPAIDATRLHQSFQVSQATAVVARLCGVSSRTHTHRWLLTAAPHAACSSSQPRPAGCSGNSLIISKTHCSLPKEVGGVTVLHLDPAASRHAASETASAVNRSTNKHDCVCISLARNVLPFS